MYTVPQENDRLNREGNKKKVKCEGYATGYCWKGRVLKITPH